jgi:hypothetical protein
MTGENNLALPPPNQNKYRRKTKETPGKGCKETFLWRFGGAQADFAGHAQNSARLIPNDLLVHFDDMTIGRK